MIYEILSAVQLSLQEETGQILVGEREEALKEFWLLILDWTLCREGNYENSILQHLTRDLEGTVPVLDNPTYLLIFLPSEWINEC